MPVVLRKLGNSQQNRDARDIRDLAWREIPLRLMPSICKLEHNAGGRNASTNNRRCDSRA